MKIIPNFGKIRSRKSKSSTDGGQRRSGRFSSMKKLFRIPRRNGKYSTLKNEQVTHQLSFREWHEKSRREQPMNLILPPVMEPQERCVQLGVTPPPCNDHDCFSEDEWDMTEAKLDSTDDIANDENAAFWEQSFDCYQPPSLVEQSGWDDSFRSERGSSHGKVWVGCS